MMKDNTAGRLSLVSLKVWYVRILVENIPKYTNRTEKSLDIMRYSVAEISTELSIHLSDVGL